MTKSPMQILEDWEDQAMERDHRDPMRAQILSEAAILRAAVIASAAPVIDPEPAEKMFWPRDFTGKQERYKP